MTEHLATVEGTTGWTIETLKESIDQRFADNQKAVETAMTSQEKLANAALIATKEAITKAETSTEKRFDAVNEAMGKVSSQNADLLPRAEYIANHKALDDRITVVDNAVNKTSGDKNLFVTTSELDTKLTLVVNRFETSLGALAASMKPIVDYVSQQKGQTVGSQLTKSGLISAISITGVIIGIVVFLATTFIK